MGLGARAGDGGELGLSWFSLNTRKQNTGTKFLPDNLQVNEPVSFEGNSVFGVKCVLVQSTSSIP